MTIRDVLTDPDPRLREPSRPVDNFDPALTALVTDLLDTMGEHGCIGLSAPQLGVPHRVLVIHVPNDAYGESVYINPEILDRRRPGFIEETCLSLPDIAGTVMRPTRVIVRAHDATGRGFEREIQGLHAVCLQHEIDHLDGTLFTDRMTWLGKLRLRLTGRGQASAA